LFRYHVAKKKIAYCDSEGKTVVPTDINGWKAELFVFDVFLFAENMAALEVGFECRATSDLPYSIVAIV